MYCKYIQIGNGLVTYPSGKDFYYLRLWYYFQFLGKWYEIKWIPETYIDPEDNFKDYVWRQSLYNDSYVHIISHGRFVFFRRSSGKSSSL